MVYAWPEAEIGMMDADSWQRKSCMQMQMLRQLKSKAARLCKALQTSPDAAAEKRICGYDHRIRQIPENMSIGAFEMLFTKREDRPMKKHGTI